MGLYNAYSFVTGLFHSILYCVNHSYCSMWITHSCCCVNILFVHFHCGKHLRSFQSEAVTNSAVMNISTYVLNIHISVEYYLRKAHCHMRYACVCFKYLLLNSINLYSHQKYESCVFSTASPHLVFPF